MAAMSSGSLGRRCGAGAFGAGSTTQRPAPGNLEIMWAVRTGTASPTAVGPEQEICAFRNAVFPRLQAAGYR